MSTVERADVLAAFEERERPGVPLSAPEVADAVGCARRTAHKKLTRLAEEGTLATKKVGARGRVWWLPAPRRAAPASHERRTYERALRELHDASRRLIGAETREAVAEVAVAAAQRVLGLSLSGLWLYAPERDVLDPVAWTESGVEEYGEPPPFPIEGSLVGAAFREGEHRVYDDVTAEEGRYDPETRVRSELILPLGEYGVLNASSPEVGAFDDADVSLARILAANVETALERADRLAERRARRRELERQRDELGTLNRINALIEETIGALVDAATREEIERTVCERLATSEFYVGAWILERDAAGSVVLRTGADADGEAIDDLATSDGSTAADPVATAMAKRELRAVPRLDDEGVPDWLRTAAAASGARSCLAVPLSYADTVFGALVVCAPEPDDFGDRERAAFATLGRVVGFVINATNNRRLLLGNTAVELETALGDADAWFVATAARLGATISVEGLVPADEAHIEYVAVEDPPTDATPDDLVATSPVEDVRVLAAGEDRWFLECTLRGADALWPIAEYGATVRTTRATPDGGTVTARFPASASPREAMAVVREAFPGAELVAKRVVDVSDRSTATIRRTVEARLTTKQLTALRAAILAGYYELPRGTTAEELADSLGIAPSTFHQHLRAAHRKLLATVFDDFG